MINGDTIARPALDEPPIAPDVTALPPAKYLPKAVQKLVAARDAAWEKYNDFEDEHHDVIRPDWRRVAEAADRRAAETAVAEGRDPFAEESHVDRASKLRPRVIGALNALAAEVRKADAAAVAAVRRELPAITKVIGADMKAAADEYTAAWSAAMDARGRYGTLVDLRRWAAAWEVGSRADAPRNVTAAPRTADGFEVRDINHRPLYGGAEVDAVAESFRRAGYPDVYGATGEPAQQDDPKVTIRSLRNGAVFQAKASHAYAFVQRGDAEYADPDAVPDHFHA
ncbi:hypothetical protein OHA60_06605 [Streptomyces cellulosae]|nr:hypothetical protein OHA60_06605 [Streptomyces cellulosae]